MMKCSCSYPVVCLLLAWPLWVDSGSRDECSVTLSRAHFTKFWSLMKHTRKYKMLEQVDYIRIDDLRVDKESDGWKQGICHTMSRCVPKDRVSWGVKQMLQSWIMGAKVKRWFSECRRRRMEGSTERELFPAVPNSYFCQNIKYTTSFYCLLLLFMSSASSYSTCCLL